MGIRDDKRQAALDRIADHLLAHGLGPSSLRALGAASGNSDRMLLYYFADKDEIVISALQVVCLRLAKLLETAVGEAASLAPGPLLRQLAPIMRGPVFRPYMRFWIELVALAARDQEPFHTAAGQIADYFVSWVADRLDIGGEAERMIEAAALVALLDGVVLLDCVGKQASSDAILQREERR